MIFRVKTLGLKRKKKKESQSFTSGPPRLGEFEKKNQQALAPDLIIESVTKAIGLRGDLKVLPPPFLTSQHSSSGQKAQLLPDEPAAITP